MKLISRIYPKFRKHRQVETKRIMRSEVVQNAIKMRALTCAESILNNSRRGQNIIVSLTTFGKRINFVYLALESIAQQTLKPDKVILWLSEKYFSDEKLPITLRRLIDRGVTVFYRKDIGPHTKLLYAVKEYSKDIIITIDDDIIYPIDLIENLYNTHLEFPYSICCNVAAKMNIDKNIKFWGTKIYNEKKTSITLLPFGVNGVLYIPDCFDKDVFDIEKMKLLAPYADDIWFKLMSMKNKVPVTVTGCYDRYNDFIVLDSAYINALSDTNIHKGFNFKQLKAVWEFYNVADVIYGEKIN